MTMPDSDNPSTYTVPVLDEPASILEDSEAVMRAFTIGQVVTKSTFTPDYEYFLMKGRPGTEWEGMEMEISNNLMDRSISNIELVYQKFKHISEYLPHNQLAVELVEMIERGKESMVVEMVLREMTSKNTPC